MEAEVDITPPLNPSNSVKPKRKDVGNTERSFPMKERVETNADECKHVGQQALLETGGY